MSGDCGHGWGYHYDGPSGPCYKCIRKEAPITPKQVYDKYLSGDPITDEELAFGLKFFKSLADDLCKVGPVFRLAANEAQRVYTGLYDFKQARARKH